MYRGYKIYVFLWFWLLVLLLVTSISILSHLALLAMPALRWREVEARWRRTCPGT